MHKAATLLCIAILLTPTFARTEPLPAEEQDEESATLTYAGLGIMGAGAIVTGVGITFALSADRDMDNVGKRDMSQLEVARLLQEANEKTNRANVLLISGLATVAVGLGLLVFDLTHTDEVPTFQVAPTDSGVVATVRLTW